MLKSNGPPRPKIRLKKFGFSLKIVPANIVRKLPSQRCFKPLFIASFNFSHKRRNVRFKGLRRVHTRLCSKNRTQRHTRRNRGRFGWGRYYYPQSVFARFGNPARPGVRTAYFAAFGAWSWVLPKNAESLRDSDALMRVAVPRRRGPAGLRDLFYFCRNCGLYALRSGPFRVCEARGGITLEMSRNVQSGNTQNLKSSAASDQAAVCACARSRYFAGGSPSGLRV